MAEDSALVERELSGEVSVTVVTGTLVARGAVAIGGKDWPRSSSVSMPK